jgi:ceramidase
LASSAPDALTSRAFGRRVCALLALGVIAAAGAFALPRIPQDPAYHAFADERDVLGIPNALNVLSNLPLVVVGIIGLAAVARVRAGWERAAFRVLFASLTLTGVGSAYYHAAPTTATLFWDRLPMAAAFMALFALTLGERVSPRSGPWLLPIAIMVGVASVVVWRLGESAGAGDLRFYGLVQCLPAVLIPLALVLFPAHGLRTSALLAAIGWYAVAKLCEALDRPIFAVGGIVSGHTLKHLAAAMAAAWLLRVALAWRHTQVAELTRPVGRG